jgi:phosphatidylserine/phosphatidylglycerophosphate/cardiolipin synthase-like enzyme
MKLTDYTLTYLKEFISGDKGYTPKISGPIIIELFNSVGFQDSYSGGMPEHLSRNSYILDRLKKINSTENLKKILEIVFSQRHFLRNQELDLETAVENVNKVLSTDGYHFTNKNEKYLISLMNDFIDDSSSEVHFEELRQLLINEISKAKYLIWVAVAWFTDKELFKILEKKRVEGLSIQVLILDDEINTNSGIEFKKGFYTIKVKKRGPYENIMHHKFCIIDLKTVLHGSYNWTNKAQYNNETLDVELNRENAEKFADEFMKLKKASA